jgi:hypothetical protein
LAVFPRRAARRPRSACSRHARSGTEGSQTLRWSKADSNCWSHPNALHSKTHAPSVARLTPRFVIRDQEFESRFLQQRVCEPSVPHGASRAREEAGRGAQNNRVELPSSPICTRIMVDGYQHSHDLVGLGLIAAENGTAFADQPLDMPRPCGQIGAAWPPLTCLRGESCPKRPPIRGMPPRKRFWRSPSPRHSRSAACWTQPWPWPRPCSDHSRPRYPTV